MALNLRIIKHMKERTCDCMSWSDEFGLKWKEDVCFCNGFRRGI